MDNQSQLAHSEDTLEALQALLRTYTETVSSTIQVQPGEPLVADAAEIATIGHSILDAITAVEGTIISLQIEIATAR